jgi:hypothetical protein
MSLLIGSRIEPGQAQAAPSVAADWGGRNASSSRNAVFIEG